MNTRQPVNPPAGDPTRDQPFAAVHDEQRRAIERGHEQDTAGVRGLMIFAVCFMLSVGGCALCVWGIAALYQSMEQQPRASVRNRARPEAGGPGADAANWQNPPAALAELRRREYKLLHRYAVVDRGRRIIRIPIDRAMRLLARQKRPLNAAGGGP